MFIISVEKLSRSLLMGIKSPPTYGGKSIYTQRSNLYYKTSQFGQARINMICIRLERKRKSQMRRHVTLFY